MLFSLRCIVDSSHLFILTLSFLSPVFKKLQHCLSFDLAPVFTVSERIVVEVKSSSKNVVDCYSLE